MDTENPFEDASIKQLDQPSGLNQADAGMENAGYHPPELNNPFGDEDNITEKSPVLGGMSQADNIYDTAGGGGFAELDVEQGGGGPTLGNEDRLRNKEQELIEREKLIAEREAAFNKMGVQLPNWPKFRPIIYNDIQADIPEIYRAHVQRLFYVCVLLWFTLALNWIVMLICFISNTEGGIGTFIWATIYALTGIPGSWRGWYKNVYTSLKNKGSSIRWWMFIIGYFAHTGFVCVGAAGFPGFAQSGLLFMISVFSKSKGLGFLTLICAAGWGILAVSGVMLFKKSWNLFRDSDAQKNIQGELAVAAVGMQLNGMQNQNQPR